MSIGYRTRIQLAQIRLMREGRVTTHEWKPPEKKKGVNPNMLAAKINGTRGAKASPFTYERLKGK